MLENTNLYLGKRIINVDSFALVTFVKINLPYCKLQLLVDSRVLCTSHRQGARPDYSRTTGHQMQCSQNNTSKEDACQQSRRFELEYFLWCLPTDLN